VLEASKRGKGNVVRFSAGARRLKEGAFVGDTRIDDCD